MNLEGQIIGINTLVVRGDSSAGDVTEGIGFAIASNTVNAVTRQLIDQGSVARPISAPSGNSSLPTCTEVPVAGRVGVYLLR